MAPFASGVPEARTGETLAPELLRRSFAQPPVGYRYPVTTTLRRAAAGAAALTLTTALTACSSVDEPEARRVATEFARLASSDPGAACALLAPRTLQQVTEDGDGDCAKGLTSDKPEPPGTVTSVSVAINGAQVVMTDQVLFLAHFDTGWKVLAAGCSRENADDAVPYDCSVKGA